MTISELFIKQKIESKFVCPQNVDELFNNLALQII